MTDAEWERLKRVADALEQFAFEMEAARTYDASSLNGGAPKASQSNIITISAQKPDSNTHLIVA